MKPKSEIEKILICANDEYRKGSPIMSDSEFDTILDEYKNRFIDDYVQFRSKLFESPGTFKHEFVIGSLEKIKTDDPASLYEWVDFTDEKEFIVSSKIDGLSMVCYYVNGKLKYAITRGDGYNGEIQTQKLKYVVPRQINAKGSVVIRGECTLTYESFEEAKHIEKKEYKNLRNASVGIVNSKTVNPELCKCLKFFAYEIYKSEVKFTEYSDILSTLKSWGFTTPTYHKFTKDKLTKENLDKYYEYCSKKEPFDIDGLVIQSNHTFNEISQKLPDYAKAYKMNQLVAESEIINIEWNMSKGGYFAPIGIIKPVYLGGSEIKRLTLFNYKTVISKQIGISSKIRLQKSGDIIPHLKEVITTSSNFNFPKTCPKCGTSLIINGVELQCPNKHCSAQTFKKLAYFLKNLGVEVAAETSLANWNIYSIEDLLTFKPEEKSKNQTKFYSELLEKLFKAKRKDIISAFDYDGVSKKTFDKLFSKYFNTVQQFLDAFTNIEDKHAWLKEMSKVEAIISGVSLKTLTAIATAFNTYHIFDYNKIITDKRYNIQKDEDDIIEINDTSNLPLNGQSFCFTGALSINRKEAENMAIKLGAEIKGVSKSLTYLVSNTPNSGSSKNKKAAQLGVKVIDEKEFFKIINYNPFTGNQITSENKSRTSIDDL